MFAARYYFAWRMIEEADRLDRERRYLKKRRNLSRMNRVLEEKFIQLYRLSKRGFTYLCAVLRQNTDLKESQRMLLETKVLSALQFYANGDIQRVVGETNQLSQEAISRYVHEVTEALNHPNVINKFIKFPCSPEDRQRVTQNFYHTYGFPGVIGCIDASHFRIKRPKKDEEHLYYCKKHYYSLNVQVVSDHEGRILSVNPKFGGASHDTFIFNNSAINTFMQTLHQNGELVWLLGDSGYPQRPWLMTPYMNPAPESIQESYNKVHSKTRVIIETTVGRLKHRWRCLHDDKVLHYKPEKCAKMIIACSVLHNIALDFKDFLSNEEIHDTPAIDGSSSSPHYAEDDNILFEGCQIRDKLATKLYEANT